MREVTELKLAIRFCEFTGRRLDDKIVQLERENAALERENAELTERLWQQMLAIGRGERSSPARRRQLLAELEQGD